VRVAIRSIGSLHLKLANERHDHAGRVEAFHSVEGAAVRCRHMEQLPLFVADKSHSGREPAAPTACPSSHAAGFGHSQRRQCQMFGPPEWTARPTTSGRRQDMDRSATPPSRSRQWQSAASSPVRSPGWSAPPEIRPCAPGALPSGRVESPRRGAGGGTVVCICRHAQDSQPGDQGGCGHSTALSASPSTTCSARAVTALWQWQCRSLIPLFWPDGCCHELGGDGTWLPEGLSHSSRPPRLRGW
jgi:hypothetical protein